MHVRGHFDLIVVGEHEPHFHFANLLEIRDLIRHARPEATFWVIYDVRERNRVASAGLHQASARNAPFDEWFNFGMFHPVNENPLTQKQRTSHPIFGRIVGKTHQNPADVPCVQTSTQHPLEGIVVHRNRAVLVTGIHVRKTDLGEIADPDGPSEAQELCERRQTGGPLIFVNSDHGRIVDPRG